MLQIGELCTSIGLYFYLRRQLAAGQVMGPVVVVVLLLFKTYLNLLIWSCHGRGKGGKVLGKAMSEGIQPRRKFYMRSQHLCRIGLGDVSRLSSGLDPQMSRDPTPKKVLYAKSALMSDRSWQGVKTFFGVGSPNIKGSNPEESFIREVSTYV